MSQYFTAWNIADFSLFERRTRKMWVRMIDVRIIDVLLHIDLIGQEL